MFVILFFLRAIKGICDDTRVLPLTEWFFFENGGEFVGVGGEGELWLLRQLLRGDEELAVHQVLLFMRVHLHLEELLPAWGSPRCQLLLQLHELIRCQVDRGSLYIGHRGQMHLILVLQKLGPCLIRCDLGRRIEVNI